jgi:prepilin-type N-terminal cleavage/methylation domain-containing protein
MDTLNHRAGEAPHVADRGFTLVEMLIAITITVLLLASISQAFSFSARLWMRESQGETVRRAEHLVRLMSRQLGSPYPFDPSVVGGRLEPIQAEEHRMAIVTSNSVKASHGGAPVLAVYYYDESAKTLEYAEMPLNWNDPEAMVRFSQDPASGHGTHYSRRYSVYSFSIDYLQAEDDFGDSADGSQVSKDINRVVVSWKDTADMDEQTREMRIGYLALLP